MALCTICADPGLRKVIDGNLAEKVSFAGISRSLASFGMSVTVDIISRHAKHYAPEPEREPGTRKLDFAVMVRDKAATLFEGDGLVLTDKDHVPGINSGLKAQATIDKREQAAQKQTGADSLISLLLGFRRDVQPVPILLDDPNVIEGTAIELD